MSRYPRRFAAWTSLPLGLVLASLHPPILSSAEAERSKEKWIELFDGKSLDGWIKTNFGGEGEVRVEAGAIHLATGDDLTGVTYERPFPKQNYEVTLEAKRTAGHDFFCGLTFPVGESPCSLILGGWGGGVTGLSSVDGQDASENETTFYREYENDVWYRVRLRVTPQRIEAWVDDKPIVDLELEGHKLSIRSEVDLSRPLGIASWRTGAALRKLRYRPIE